MKKLFTSPIRLCLFLVFTLVGEAFSQKIPFQGQLIENDVPVNGSRNFVFSISGSSWTETHTNVQINNGLYSVVLGSLVPLPADLFSSADTRQLNITVGNLALTPLTIYAPLASSTMSLVVDAAPDGKDLANFNLSGQGTVGKLYRALSGTSSVVSGINTGVSGYGLSNSATTNNVYGVFGRASGDGLGQHRGVYGEAVSPANSNNAQYGLYGAAFGSGTGSHFGLFATSQGAPAGRLFNYGALTSADGIGRNNIGLRGLATGAGDGSTGFNAGSYNNGVQGFARGNSWGNTGVYGWVYNDPTTGLGAGVDNNGVVGRSEVNDGTTTINNAGVRGDARGPGINKGVVGMASGGAQNWAGWFDGDVKVNGKIESAGGLTFDKTTDAIEMQEVNGLFARVAGNGPSSGSARYSGVFGLSEASNGFNAGVKGVAVAKTTNASFTFGVIGEVFPDSNGPSKGIVYGARGEVYPGNYDGGSVAVRGLTRNTSALVSGFLANTGGYLDARDNPNQNVGIYANAVGGTTSKNYGVWARASGGAENWAGLFEGDVKITGNLDLANGISSNNISGSQFIGKGNDTEVNFLLGQNFFFGGNDSANRGLLSLFSGVAERNVTNVDIRRVDLSVSDDGFGKSVGRLNLGGPVGGEFGYRGFVKTGAKTDDGNNYHGELTLLGQSTLNIEMGAKRWEGAQGYNRPFLSMKGNQNDQAPNLVWLEVNSFEGKEFGNLTFTSSDGRSSRIGAYDMALGDPFNGDGAYLNGVNGDGQFTGNLQVGKPFVTNGSGIFLGKDGNANFSKNINLGGSLFAPSTILNGDATNGIRMYGKFDNLSSHISLDGGANHIYLWGNGNIDATGTVTAVTLTQTSDRKLKTNIRELQSPLKNLLQLRGVSYNWVDKTKSPNTQIGLIAQEVEQVYPEFVHTSEQGIKSVNYAQMVAVLIESIKELNAAVEKLQGENRDLKAELSKAESSAKKIQELEHNVNTLLSMMKTKASSIDAEPVHVADQQK